MFAGIFYRQLTLLPPLPPRLSDCLLLLPCAHRLTPS